MAGEWIAIDVNLGTKPEVLEIVEATGADTSQVIGRLVQFWGWAVMNTADGVLRATPARVARICGGDEAFWLAVELSGWLSFNSQAQTVTVTGWDQRFSQAAKARLVDARRKAISRGKIGNVREVSEVCPNSVRPGSDVFQTRGEEKRVEDKREEIQNTSCFVATTETPKRRRSRPADSIRWTPEGGWEGITEADRKKWAEAYPACNVSGELARAALWLEANPVKAKKRKWRAFVTTWLSRSQERGGGMPSNRPQAFAAGERPPVALTSRRWRDDAAANMTDAQYLAWRQSMAQARPQEAQASPTRAVPPVKVKSPREGELPF
jgi:hypothetical protein